MYHQSTLNEKEKTKIQNINKYAKVFKRRSNLTEKFRTGTMYTQM